MMANTATQFIPWTQRQADDPSKLESSPPINSTSSTDPADAYNKFIWDLACKFTNSAEEARAAVEEMRSDIRYCAEKGLVAGTKEDLLVSEIAWRRLKKFLE